MSSLIVSLGVYELFKTVLYKRAQKYRTTLFITLFLLTFTLIIHSTQEGRYYVDLVYFITFVPDTSDSSATQAIRMQHERHECNQNETQATRVRHECYTSDTSATQVLHERYECYTSKKF